MSEKFSLKWNDFQSNWNSSLSELRKDTDFADVTLISEDKVKFSAHKILLSSCSNMFKFILKENIHANPLVYLGGVSSQNIEFILDYVYYGGVKVIHEHLDSFLESAQKLEILGLIGGIEESYETKDEDLSFRKNQTQIPMSKEEEALISEDTRSSLVNAPENADVKQRRQYSRAPPNDGTMIYVGNMTPEEIEVKTKELYKRIDGFWTCLQCFKTCGQQGSSGNIREHVETHFDGLCYRCHTCSKEFRSKNGLYYHKSKKHLS